MNCNTKKKIMFSSMFSILIIGIIIGSFFDYQINSFLFSKNNVFGLIIAGIGEWPTHLSIVFVGGFVFGFTYYKNYKKGIKILSLLFMIASLVYASIYIGGVLKSSNSFGVFTSFFKPVYIYIPIGFLISCPMIIPGFLVGRKCEDKNVIYTMLILIGIYVISILIVSSIKEIMSRPRFRLVYEVGEDMFRNFWQPFKDCEEFISSHTSLNITKEEFRSFPSGHTSTSAAMVYILGFLPIVFPKLKKHQTLLFIIGFIWMMFIAFTRMLVGAHYLTDVSFGGLIQLSVFVVGYCIIKKKKLTE